MNNKQGARAAHNVINLNEADDFAAHLSGISNGSQQSVLEVITTNPRFSAPANDEPNLDNPEQLAPTRADCRQARLLCMWVDILAEGEDA